MPEKEIDRLTAEKEIEFELEPKAKRKETIIKIIYFLIGLGITLFLCFRCLPCNSCNTAVVIYLSLLSLIFFANSFLPISTIMISFFKKFL